MKHSKPQNFMEWGPYLEGEVGIPTDSHMLIPTQLISCFLIVLHCYPSAPYWWLLVIELMMVFFCVAGPSGTAVCSSRRVDLLRLYSVACMMPHSWHHPELRSPFSLLRVYQLFYPQLPALPDYRTAQCALAGPVRIIWTGFLSRLFWSKRLH